MHTATDRLEFAPPPTPGLLRALILALLAHGLLMAALTLGIQWKHEVKTLSAEAELWSTLPVEAAPELRAQEPESTPPVAPEPIPKSPMQTEPEPTQPPTPPEIDIALQQEKLRLKKQHDLEQAKLAEQKLEKQKLERLKQDKLKQEIARQDKEKLEKLKHEQADKAQRAALDKKKTELEARELELQRAKNLARMTGMAGASGNANAAGTALKASGPSAGYAGRIRARIKPNIVFTEDIVGNPTAEVEVRTAPDGTILSRKLQKSSGVKAWDEAVLKAIDKTEVLPRDTDGRVPPSLEISFKPKD